MLIVHVDSSGKGTYKPQTLVSEPTLPPKEHYQASNFCSPTDFRIRDLNRTSLEFLNINTFWDTYLPSPRMATGEKCFPFTSGAVSRWAGYTTHYLPQTETVRCALLALSTAHLGKAQGNVYLLQRGFELYGHALTQVGNALMAPNGRKNFCLLNSCRLLALFEVCSDSWRFWARCEIDKADGLVRNSSTLTARAQPPTGGATCMAWSTSSSIILWRPFVFPENTKCSWKHVSKGSVTTVSPSDSH